MTRPILISLATAAMALPLGLAACNPGPSEPAAAPPPATPAPASARANAREATLERAQTRAERRFDRVDADSNGIVTEAEVAASTANGIRWADGLMRADSNGDGEVTREEQSGLTARIFQRQDKNKDGVVTEDERPRRRDAAAATANAEDDLDAE